MLMELAPTERSKGEDNVYVYSIMCFALSLKCTQELGKGRDKLWDGKRDQKNLVLG